ncbi:phosphoglycerate mutase (2,3-diphosphoglycerate-independent), partial [Aliarcobacter butzleri]
MTHYDKNVFIPALFPKDNPTNTLAEVISHAGLSQLHTAETEKYAHDTFFFNGGVDEPVLNDSRVLFPSPQVATYDLKP